MEACQSGLMYLFAKEVGALNPLGGSNPPASAFARRSELRRTQSARRSRRRALYGLPFGSPYWYHDVEAVDSKIMEKISIAPYNSAWVTLFEQEAQKIRGVFLQGCDIEHIGSTSVPGLEAKPVIDIMLGFKTLDAPRIIERMESIGYKHWKEDTFQHVRLMFTQWNNDMSERLVNVHATVKGGEFWDEQLEFRDKLRTNKILAQEYSELKKNLAKAHSSDPDTYTVAKTEFVKKALMLQRYKKGEFRLWRILKKVFKVIFIIVVVIVVGYGGFYFLASRGTVSVNVVPGARTFYEGQVSIEPVSLEQIKIQLKEKNIYYAVDKETIIVYPRGQGWGPLSFILSKNTIKATKDIPGTPDPEKYKEEVRQDVEAIGGMITIKENTWRITKTTYPWTVLY